jgi:hypothetical protein
MVSGVKLIFFNQIQNAGSLPVLDHLADFIVNPQIPAGKHAGSALTRRDVVAQFRRILCGGREVGASRRAKPASRSV